MNNNKIIAIVTMVAIAFFTVIMYSVSHLFAAITLIPIYILPMIIAIGCFITLLFFKKKLISLFATVCFMVLATSINNDYGEDTFGHDGYFIDCYNNRVVNCLGFTVFCEGDILYYKDGVVYGRTWRPDGYYAYSLYEDCYIVPKGHTFNSFGKIIRNNGRYGIESLEGDILLPTIYKNIKFLSGDFILVKNNQDYYEVLDPIGCGTYVSSDDEYIDYEIGSCWYYDEYGDFTECDYDLNIISFRKEKDREKGYLHHYEIRDGHLYEK
ncbi:MAG: hypothetical protein IKK87_05870 [Bacteroidaceae bacterium]|nr:hypothetical protein [Bacteroidaceae bacterium]